MWTNKGAWSDSPQQAGNIKWLLNSSALEQRNMRLSTKFKSQRLLVYHMRTWLTGVDSSRLKLLAIFFKESMWFKW